MLFFSDYWSLLQAFRSQSPDLRCQPKLWKFQRAWSLIQHQYYLRNDHNKDSCGSVARKRQSQDRDLSVLDPWLQTFLLDKRLCSLTANYSIDLHLAYHILTWFESLKHLFIYSFNLWVSCGLPFLTYLNRTSNASMDIVWPMLDPMARTRVVKKESIVSFGLFSGRLDLYLAMLKKSSLISGDTSPDSFKWRLNEKMQSTKAASLLFCIWF